MDDVTIAIKTFERPESLKDLLVSIRRFYPTIHIKIADDSKEPSVQAVTSCFSNIEYIPLRFDVGLSAGRNVLLSHIKTKYFVLCDDDFLFYEQTGLENFKKILDETDIELIGGCVMDKSETGEFNKPNLYAGDLILDSSRHLHMKVIKPDSPFVKCDIVPNWFMAGTQAVRGKTGGWDPKLKIEEHTDFFWRAKKAGLKVAFTPDVRVNHTKARNPKYRLYRRNRNDKYYLLYFRKLGIKGFTDPKETVILKDVRPRWVKFIFQQKCIPWFITLKWRNLRENGKSHIRKFKTWLACFIVEQKGMPWFLIAKWRILVNSFRKQNFIKTINLERTYVSCLDGDETIKGVEMGIINKYPNLLIKNSIDVRFLKEFKDGTDVTDEEIKASEYYQWANEYMRTYGSFQGKKDEVALAQCCRDFLDLYRAFKKEAYTYPKVYRIANSDYCMVLDGHHRLACLYVLGKKMVKAEIVGTIKNRLQLDGTGTTMKADNGWGLKKAASQSDRHGLILMYHRVAELEHDPWQLSVSPTHFEQQMQALKKYGQPVQMQEMGRNLKRFSLGGKEIVVSFDDGYADNYHNAKPILERHKIPATFFVVSGAIGSGEEYWWDELERIILSARALPALFELTIVGANYRWQISSSGRQETLNDNGGITSIPENNALLSSNRLYFALWKILNNLSSQEKKEALHEISHWAGQPSGPRPDYLPMTFEELKSLASSPLFEIGAHTAHHPMLSRLSLQEQQEEITHSKHDLENMVNQPITSFSYPFGNYSQETAKLVECSNFQNACTTEERPVRRNANPYLLPRFTVLNWDGDQFEQNLRKWMTHE